MPVGAGAGVAAGDGAALGVVLGLGVGVEVGVALGDGEGVGVGSAKAAAGQQPSATTAPIETIAAVTLRNNGSTPVYSRWRGGMARSPLLPSR